MFNVVKDLLNFLDVGLIGFHFGLGLCPLFVINSGSGDLLQQLEALRIRHGAERIYLSLLHNEIGIGLGKAGPLEKTCDFVLLGALPLEEKLVLFVPDCSTEDNLIRVFKGKAIVRVVKNYLDKGIDGSRPRSLVEQCLSFLLEIVAEGGGGNGEFES